MSVKEISTIVKTTCTAVVATVAAVCLIVLTKDFHQASSVMKNCFIDAGNKFNNTCDNINNRCDDFHKIISEENGSHLSSILNKVDDQVLSAENIDKVKNSLNRFDSVTEKIDSRVLTSENISRVSNSLSTVNSATEKVRTVGNYFSWAWHVVFGQ